MAKHVHILWKLSAAFTVILGLVLLGLELVEALAGPPGTSLERYSRLAVAVLTGAGLAIAASRYLIRQNIERPIRGLAEGMERLAEKDFDFRLEEDDADQFDALASSFNDMADMLSASLTELKKNQDYLRSILESSADIIITVNPSGKIQTINAGAERVLGYKRLEVVGEPIELLFADPEDRRRAIDRLEYTDNVVNYETQYVTKFGEIRDVLLTLSRLRNSTGAVIGTIGISKDITEEKSLQNQLILSQRFAAIGEVFTGIQHSLKNMLNACKGGAYMVRTGLKKDNRTMLEDGWAMVEEGILRMTEMSTDMLKYVKEWKPRRVRVDLAKILSDIAHVIKPTAEGKGVAFVLDLPDDLPPLYCDARMIHSSVMDIVSNALDACVWKAYGDDESPEVRLSAYSSDDRQASIVEVRDNGCGMTEKVKARIFAPFFSTKSKAGTGLGLSITSRIIGVHGGKIEVESEPNQGAVFRIVLPVEGTEKDKEKTDGKESAGSR